MQARIAVLVIHELYKQRIDCSIRECLVSLNQLGMFYQWTDGLLVWQAFVFTDLLIATNAVC